MFTTARSGSCRASCLASPDAGWHCRQWAQPRTWRDDIATIIISSDRDLRTWLDTATQGEWVERTDADLDALTARVQGMDHPAWGADWYGFFENLDLPSLVLEVCGESQKLTWDESDQTRVCEESIAEPGVRILAVYDQLTCFRAKLPEGVAVRTAVRDALKDYAAKYDGGDSTELEVTWELYEDGKEIDCGRYEWSVVRVENA